MKIHGIHIQTAEKTPSQHYIMPRRYERSQRYLRRADRMRCLGAGMLMHHVLDIEECDLQYGKSVYSTVDHHK